MSASPAAAHVVLLLLLLVCFSFALPALKSELPVLLVVAISLLLLLLVFRNQELRFFLLRVCFVLAVPVVPVAAVVSASAVPVVLVHFLLPALLHQLLLLLCQLRADCLPIELSVTRILLCHSLLSLTHLPQLLLLVAGCMVMLAVRLALPLVVSVQLLLFPLLLCLCSRAGLRPGLLLLIARLLQSQPVMAGEDVLSLVVLFPLMQLRVAAALLTQEVLAVLAVQHCGPLQADLAAAAIRGCHRCRVSLLAARPLLSLLPLLPVHALVPCELVAVQLCVAAVAEAEREPARQAVQQGSASEADAARVGRRMEQRRRRSQADVKHLGADAACGTGRCRGSGQ